MALDDFGTPSTEVSEAVTQFKDRETKEHVRNAVYGIFDSETGECLYIGEAKWLVSRLNDHYNTRTGSQIKAFVENDESIAIDASNVWERTEIKYVGNIPNGKSGRKAVESALIKDLGPRYNTKP